jgi:ketosteroid isomerase-like protein
MSEAEPHRDDSDALELSQATMAAFNARDIDAMLERLDPDIEWWPLRSETEGAFRGHDGFRRWIAETDELFEHSRAWIDVASWQGEDTILAEGRIDLQGKASGAPIELPVTWVFRLRDGKLVWGRAFNDQAAALAELDG